MTLNRAAFVTAGFVGMVCGSLSASGQPQTGSVELHVHLDGSLSAEFLYPITLERNLSLPSLGRPPASVLELKETLQTVPVWHRFDIVNEIVGGDLSIIRRAGEWFANFQADFGVWYTEVRHDPYRLARSSYANVSVDVDAAVQALQEGLAFAANRRGTQVHQLLCAMRGQPASACFDVARLAARQRSGQIGGVVGLDLAGDEKSYPNDPYIECFRFAKQKLELNTTVHAGEMVPEAESVRSAVAEMLVDRVGHGYSAAGNETVMSLLRRTRAHVEACPYSAGKRGLLHAIDEYRKQKLNYGLNTDDPSVFFDAGNYTDILEIVSSELQFTDADVKKARDAALDATFSSFAAVIAARKRVNVVVV